MFSAFGRNRTCSVRTTAVTNVLVCGSQRCCIRQGTNQNIKCTCAKVRCLVVGQHIICNCSGTKFLAQFLTPNITFAEILNLIPSKRPGNLAEVTSFGFFSSVVVETGPVHSIRILHYCFLLFGATDINGPGPPHSRGF